MRWLALCSLAAGMAGCGVHLEDIPGASTDPGQPPGNPPGDPQPDGPPVCANGRVVYLNFDGQALTQGPSDATQNRASWMTITSGAAPKYKAAATDRLQQIQNITDGVRAELSSFPVTVVTQRPQTGPYVMIVLGGVASQVGSRYGGAVNTLDCNDTRKSDVAWISDNVSPTQHVINNAVGAIGFGLGLTATTDPQDCMCGWDNNCNANNSAPCRLSATIARDPMANQLCTGQTTQDEHAAFDTAFCK